MRDAFNDTAQHKERIYSDLNGRTTALGTVVHTGDTLVFEGSLSAGIALCSHYAAFAAAAHPDKKFQFSWQGETRVIPPGMAAYDVAQLVAGESIPAYQGGFTTRARMPPEAMEGAIEGDDLGALRTVLQNNAWPDAVFKDGSTALTLAAAKGKNFVHLLLQHGASVNLAIRDGITPLMVAALAGDIDTARMLLDAGADINAVDTSGRAPHAHAPSPAMRDFLTGPYPVEAAERIARKKEAELAAAATEATTLNHDVKPMAKLKLKKKRDGETP
ncbi:MAG: ankyrin repeat domain-containing protein [Alphaproteobacteria bacterium]